MNDLRTEIRAAFESEQSAFPPPPALRAQVAAAVNARARAAGPTQQRPERNLGWLMIAAAILLTIAIVAGLLASQLMNLHPVPVKPGPVLPLASWTDTGAMLTPRSGHTATLLPDGKVLVAGGIQGIRVLASAELYDPGTGRWTATGNMVTPRAFHTATLVYIGADAKVLVAGGYNRIGGSALASAELYDPRTGAWTVTASMVTPHAGHTATQTYPGGVLVSGGMGGNGVTASTELYDPGTGRWTATGKMVAPRIFHTATLLMDGRVLVTGGADTTYDIVHGVRNKLATAELYNPNTGSWAATASMAAKRTGHTATPLLDGTVLVAGGGGVDSTELYDPSTGTWTATGTTFASPAFHTATLLPYGAVLVVGDSGAASIYDRSKRSWTAAASPVTGSDATATMLPDGNVLVAGGQVHGQGTLASAELYDPGLPVPLPPAGVIAPGTYFLSNPDTLCSGGCAAYKRIIFTLPAGWATSHGLVYKHLGQPGEVAFSAWTVDQIYDDPCHWQRSTLSPLDIAHTSFDPATGRRIITPYVGGLANQAFRGPSPRPLTQLTVAGWDGSGNYLTLALRIDLSVPANLDISKCDKGQFRSWTEWHVPGGANANHARGQLDAVYMIDVDRRTLVIDASHMPGTSAADLAELNAIIAGMIFDRS